jgi:hypothetical protein
MYNNNNFLKWSNSLAPKIVEALENRNFIAYYVKCGGEATERAISLIPEGSLVSWGESKTIRQIGLLDRIREANYRIIDRDVAKTEEEEFDFNRQTFLSDVYITSVSGISEDGQIVNVDTVGNKIAAITFGPKSVIIVVGMNKVTPTLQDTLSRARIGNSENSQSITAPKKTAEAPCLKTGSCEQCLSPDCVCSFISTTRLSKVPGRIKVILVGEKLGSQID